MKPKIDSTKFGSITIEGEEYEKDVLIRLNGNIKKRKKKLSKAIYGTSHKISLDEAEHVYENGAEKIIIGSGQNGMVQLSHEVRDFFKEKDCKVKLCPTPEAIDKWNSAKGKVIGLFHLTCQNKLIFEAPLERMYLIVSVDYCKNLLEFTAHILNGRRWVFLRNFALHETERQEG